MSGLKCLHGDSTRRLEILTVSGGSCRSLRLPKIQGSLGLWSNPIARYDGFWRKATPTGIDSGRKGVRAKARRSIASTK